MLRLIASLVSPTNPAHLPAEQDQNAKGDAIPSKDGEGVVSDVAQQPAHAKPSADEGEDEADGKEGNVSQRE